MEELDEDNQLSSFKHAESFGNNAATLLSLDLSQQPTKQEEADEVKLLARLCHIVSSFPPFESFEIA